MSDAKQELAKSLLRGKAPKTSGAPASAPVTADQPVWRQKPTSGPPVPEGINANDLLDLAFDPPKFLVDNLLTEGLTVLAGKPKHGKSWLALQLGWAVAAGATLDGRESMQGEVLYLALEDTRRRLQGRIAKLRGALNWPVPETLWLQTTFPRASDGGLYHVAEWIDRHKPAAKLVIVDTIQKFRAPPKGGGNSYAEDYEAIGGLKQMLDHYGVAGLMLHHTRKLKSDDPFDEISGTLAISGAADTLWMLDTQAKGEQARLYVTGRDIGDSTVPMRFERDSGRWVIGASAEGINTDGREVGKSPASSKLEQCKCWLLEFLKDYAYPSKEIEIAGKAAGYAPTTVRDAKVALGKNGTGQVTHRNFGGDQNNDWWSGIGPSGLWKRRPLTGGRQSEAFPD